MDKLTIIQPDDWHLHLRDGDFLARTVTDVAARFGRAIIMPNLKPPITDVSIAKAYRERILAARPTGSTFEPLLTLYLTDQTTPEQIIAAKHSGIIYGCKLYPAGATTHSAAGVTNLNKIYPVLETLASVELPLLIHGEVTDANVDIFAREQIFIERELTALTTRLPDLRIVLEHISSEFAVNWLKAASNNVAATITAHHLLITRNELLSGGLKPHFYCLPIVKTENDRAALLAAAISGNPKFFLGTDSAPHSQTNKECACANAGIYTAHTAIELYAEIFAQAKALDKLENFASRFGADFYRLPYNKKFITLEKSAWQVPATLSFGNENLIPFHAGSTINWKITHG